MWIPAAFRGTAEQARRVIAEHPFALLVLVDPASLEPVLTHIPVTVFQPELLVLEAHLARANPAARLLATGAEATFVFQGPHAYISAGWYADAQTVSTWNYLAVHARGPIQVVDQPGDVREGLLRLSGQYEPTAGGWDEATHTPAGYLAALQRGIVLFRLAVQDLQCQAKLSQNRSVADQRRIIDHLLATGRPEDAALAAWMQNRLAELASE